MCDAIQIRLASPERIRSWAERVLPNGQVVGEVTKPETINYRTLKPEMDGLFCERIFGPVKDWECHCGKYKRVRYKGIVCERCGVEVTESKVRRHRMGYIELAAVVSHVWYLKGPPSYLGLFLNMPSSEVEQVIYFHSYVVLQSTTELVKPKQLLSEDELIVLEERMASQPFQVGIGAQAIQYLLQQLDVDMEIRLCRDELFHARSSKREKVMKRLRILDNFASTGADASWMVLSVLPVIPPDLRPMVQLDGGRFATSDLNDLYRRVINRNNRLKRLQEILAPEIIIRNEKRMLQEAVDALMDNGRRGRSVVGANNRALKSLSHILEGKQGRFRQNLLGKRVDYSGRSVIVVGPELKLYQCGLPKEMALELFQPFVIQRLMAQGLANNMKAAKKIIQRKEAIVDQILYQVVKAHPVLLNRAPTLHRLGIQAFDPVLVDGRAIQLHPLVCAAFNADFDGDQMAVHVPLSVEAQAEARLLMLSVNNFLSPATGDPIIMPTQDMVIGCYYLTASNPANQSMQSHYMADFEHVLMAYEQKQIGLHTWVWVRVSEDLSIKLPAGAKKEDWIQCRPNSTFLKTTAGRIIFYQHTGISFLNFTITKSHLRDLMKTVYHSKGMAHATQLADELKQLGFRYATICGLSLGIEDLRVAPSKQMIFQWAQQAIEQAEHRWQRAEITHVEKFHKVVDTWTEASETLKQEVVRYYQYTDPLNPVYMMAFSGARGNLSQVRQLVGMRGLMADPHGQLIDLPILSNFREGLTVTEYLISSYGARKGLVDTSLRTADSGYLTRRLVDVAQDVIIRQTDCGTLRGLIVTVSTAVIGRVLAQDINKNMKRNQLITSHMVDELNALGIKEITVRSPLTCEALRCICQLCYGANLAYGTMVDLGEAVGIIAAQSIGEPGTQLTMRTFHTGGVFTSAQTASIRANMDGLVSYEGKLKPIRTRHGEQALLLETPTQLILGNQPPYQLDTGTVLLVKSGQYVKANSLLAYLPTATRFEKATKSVFADLAGEIHFDHLELDQNLVKTEGLIWIKSGRMLHLPAGAELLVSHGQEVKSGDVIAQSLLRSRAKGIVQIHPNQLELILDRLTFKLNANNGLETCVGSFHLHAHDKCTDGQVVAERFESNYQTPTGGQIFHKNGEIWLVPAAIYEVSSQKDLVDVKQGQFILANQRHICGVKNEMSGWVQLVKQNEVIKEVRIRPGIYLPNVMAHEVGFVQPNVELCSPLTTDALCYVEEYEQGILISPVYRYPAASAPKVLAKSRWLSIVMYQTCMFQHQQWIKSYKKVYLMRSQLQLKLSSEAPMNQIGVYKDSSIWQWRLSHFWNFKFQPSQIIKWLVKHNQSVESETPLAQIQLVSAYSGQVRISDHRVLIVSDQDVITYQIGEHHFQVGDVIRIGDKLNHHLTAKTSCFVIAAGPTHIQVRVAKGYFLSNETICYVKDGDLVDEGDHLASLVFEQIKTGDIIQGLPRIEEILEARKPKSSCEMAQFDGVVQNQCLLCDNGFIQHVKASLILSEATRVQAGDALTEGAINPHELLQIDFSNALQHMTLAEAARYSFFKLQAHLLHQIQQVYQSQGVEIADKHIEVILRQMTSKVVLEDAGDSDFLPGELVYLNEIENINNSLLRPALYRPILLGITKAALNTESFISAASFQETTRILAQAAIEGQIDELRGLKENVIMGRLIPAGTGANYL
uniref:DNA-directed RNA polymerase subunit n=1 Tax=Cyanidiococcus yangmingshanensis TaxID=2690220 RepID=A0A7G5VUR0_9RHOD|nr:DNA-directed RNA polymerase beta' subunit [Cyanidiococcus yangmingshanensis]QMX77427.1 DNA-directed RNA polymerase beta' subunit [Cyanidiococcus yangmingshanensis]